LRVRKRQQSEARRDPIPEDIHGTDLFEIMRITRSMRLKPDGEKCATKREAIYQAKPL
jgi:hypothetical protein